MLIFERTPKLILHRPQLKNADLANFNCRFLGSIFLANTRDLASKFFDFWAAWNLHVTSGQFAISALLAASAGTTSSRYDGSRGKPFHRKSRRGGGREATVRHVLHLWCHPVCEGRPRHYKPAAACLPTCTIGYTDWLQARPGKQYKSLLVCILSLER